MDRRINKTKVKLTQIPEVYSKSYKNILKRVVNARSLQEIGDVETLNQTQLGKLKEQGFKFEILNEAVKDSTMDLDYKYWKDSEGFNYTGVFINGNWLAIYSGKLYHYQLGAILTSNKNNGTSNAEELWPKFKNIPSKYESTVKLLKKAHEKHYNLDLTLESNQNNFESYLEAIKNIKTKVVKENILQDLYNQFKNLNYKVELNNNLFYIENRNGFEITFKFFKNKIYAIVQGYKTDIDLGEVSNKFKDAKTLIDSINIKWMKENDPNGDRWQ